MTTNKRPVGERIRCACPCKREFQRMNPNDKYFSAGCCVKAKYARAEARKKARKAA